MERSALKDYRDAHLALVLLDEALKQLENLYSYASPRTRTATSAMVRRLKELQRRELRRADAAEARIS